MSIQERIRQIHDNSGNWRNKIQSCLVESEIDVDKPDVPSIKELRESLTKSQDEWRNRVEREQADRLTGDERRKRSLSATRVVRPLILEDVVKSPLRPPATPIIRVAKENAPSRTEKSEFQFFSADASDVEKAAPPDFVRQTVHVPTVQNDAFLEFFTSESLMDNTQTEDIIVPHQIGRPLRDIPETYEKLLSARRAARPERRNPSRAQNPLKSSSKRIEVRTEYEEVRRPVSAMQQIPGNTRPETMLRSIDPADRIARETALRYSTLADSVITSLSSKENFSDTKSKLRQVRDSDTLPLSTTQLQLLPYKPVMLLQIKGRRQIQVRLIAPMADSINSGDCFLLVTTDNVFAWFGQYANVVEVNKAHELADWIYKHHELGFRSSSAPGYLSIHEDQPSSGKSTSLQKDLIDMKFWKALGYTGPQHVQACGIPEEDELYEALMQHTNRVYQVNVDKLIPCVKYWGCTIKHELLRSDEAFVFDFGSEVYLWTGQKISPDLRAAGIELVMQLYQAPYDYSGCRLNPLDPLCAHKHIKPTGSSRPTWTLLGKLSEKGETVLFKSKFSNWPDLGMMRLHLTPNVKPDEMMTTAFKRIKPVNADELYDAISDRTPPPAPPLLTLGGRFIGRGCGEGSRWEDGIRRRFRVESGHLRVWHVSEFHRTELDADAHGQFHQEHTYVIRWPFKLIHVGSREIRGRVADSQGEQCAYFFWHGSQSKITEQGAAAMMTVELDEERGPHLRVEEGKEPSAFCRIFNGRMIIHAGQQNVGTSTLKKRSRIRLFYVRGEIPCEGHLLEVPSTVTSLRDRGAFLMLQYADYVNFDSEPSVIQKSWLWFGRAASEASISTARHIVNRLREHCPSKLGAQLPSSIVEVRHSADKLGPGEFMFLLNAEDSRPTMMCANLNQVNDMVVAWELIVSIGEQMVARRLTYYLQCDPDTLRDMQMNSTRSERDKPITNLDDKDATPAAKAIAERFHHSRLEMMENELCQSDAFLRPSFPYLLSGLYNANQPALFIVFSTTHPVYLWHGWQPSRKIRPISARIAMDNESPDGPLIAEGTEKNSGDDGITKEVDAGSARSRFHCHFKAALQTAAHLANKVNKDAVVVYAGLEPPEFLSLFPPCKRMEEAGSYFKSEGKLDGQKDPVESILTAIQSSSSFTLAELQVRPLPVELDATRLEDYLDSTEFQDAFGMSKDEFGQLPKWKKIKLKKLLGLH